MQVNETIRDVPITESGSTHELNVEDDINEVRLNTDDDSFRGKRYVSRLDDRNDAISLGELLFAETGRSILGLEKGLARDSVDHRHLEGIALLPRNERVCEFLDGLNSVLHIREIVSVLFGEAVLGAGTDLVELLRVEWDLFQVSYTLILDPRDELLHSCIDLRSLEKVLGMGEVCRDKVQDLSGIFETRPNR